MGHGSPEITFTNSTGAKIYVAYMRLDYNCLTDCGQPWKVLGWIGLDPGETETRVNPTENQWFYYYAESVNGDFWAGPYIAEVRRTRFRKCTCVGATTYYQVGFRELDTVKYSGVKFII